MVIIDFPTSCHKINTPKMPFWSRKTILDYLKGAHFKGKFLPYSIMNVTSIESIVVAHTALNDRLIWPSEPSLMDFSFLLLDI